MNRRPAFALFALAFMALAFLPSFAAALGPSIAITNYSVVPSTIKPGSSGKILLTLANMGDQTANSITISHDLIGVNSQGTVFAGDIGPSGSTLVSIPFSVPSTFKPQVFSLSMTVYYNNKATPLSVLLSITKPPILQAETLSVSQGVVSPGDSFSIRVRFSNAGGAANNLVISYPSDSAFSPTGTSQISIGSLAEGEMKEVEIPFRAGTAIASGVYTVPVTLAYDDSNGFSSSSNITLGPIAASATTDDLAISLVTPQGALGLGDSADLRVNIHNLQNVDLTSLTVSLVPDANASQYFTLLSENDQRILTIPAGQTASVNFKVGVSPSALVTFYPLSIRVTYQSPRRGSATITKQIGVQVSGNPALSTIVTSNPAPLTTSGDVYTLSIQVSNTGNTPVRALSMHASSPVLNFVGGNEGYIGTLNIDDYSTPQFTVLVKKGTAPGSHPLSVQLTYKDTYNQVHVETQNVTVDVVSPEVAALASQKNGNSSPLPLIIGGIIVLAVAYLAYRRFRHKEKRAAKASE